MSSLPAASGQAGFSLGIDGMICASCVSRVEKAIVATPGVASASVNLVTKRAEVVFSGAPDIAAVVAAIGKAGYGTTVETARFDIDKMSCASCVNHVEKAFKKIPGVIEANVNLATRTGTVRFAAGTTNAGDLAKAATSAGYPAHEIKPDALASSCAGQRGEELTRSQARASGRHDSDGARLRTRDGLPYVSRRPSACHEYNRHAGQPDCAIRFDRAGSVRTWPALFCNRISGAVARRTRYERAASRSVPAPPLSIRRS